MSAFELLAAGYFAALAVLAFAAPVSWLRRACVAALAAAAALAVAAVSRQDESVLRAWIPHGYLIAGYWLPGLLVPPVGGATRFEAWLARLDCRLRPRLPAVPAAITHATELAYLLCYPLVPAAFVVVRAAGTSADLTRFWVATLLSGFVCYVTLPWLVSRPPRLVAETAPAQSLAAVNAFVLGRVSHQLNTFPSGHVAVATAAAGSLLAVSPAAAIVVGCAAAAVAVGAAAGRYHYVVDVLTGACVGAAAAVIARAAV